MDDTSLETAEALIEAGQLDDALAALDQHLAANPDAMEAHRLRASLLARLPGRARDALADLHALETPTASDTLLRAQILERLGDSETAFAAIEQAWVQQRDPRLVEFLLRDMYRRGESDRALGLLADLEKTWRWLGWSGDFYALKGDYAIAAEHYCSAIEQLEHAEKNAISETQKAHLLLKRADAYRRLKEFAEAETDYQDAEAIIPNDPTIRFNRGLLAFEQGDLRRALPLCHEALDHAPDALLDEMRKTLKDEPRYHTLAQALLG